MGRHGPGYISPSVQRNAVQRWADAYNVQIAQWHFDEDRSGGTQNRPGIREAIRRVEAQEIGGIACWKLNRFGRNVIGALDDIQRIKKAGGDVVFVEEQIDTSGPFGQFLLTVLLAVAAWERDNLSANFEIAKARAVERGAYVSRTPWGFVRNEDSTLSPHPDRAEIVKEAFRIAAGDSLQSTMRYLEDTAPERRWTTTKVRRLLSQRSYLGETRNGEIVKTGTHEPIVSRSIWEAAQSAPASRQSRGDFPLSGLLRCATCGSPMIGSRGGKGQRTYRCSSTTSWSREPCQRGAVITASIVEDYARGLLEGIEATVGEAHTDALTLLERAVADAEGELDAFAADMTLRRALGERYRAHLDSRVQAVEKARAAYREQARDAETALRLESVDVTEDPQLLGLVLRSMFAALEVRPGRGLRVADRVRLVPLHGDRPTGVSDPERSQ